MGVFKKNGRWFIDYYYEGQRIRERAGETKKMAQDALATRRAEILQGRFEWRGKQAPVNFREFAEQEYLPYSKDKKGPNTYRRDQGLIAHLCDYFGRQNLSSITPEMIEKYMRWRRDGNSAKFKPAAATVNREVACLKNIFNMAIKWKTAFKNPVREVKLYKEPKGSMRTLSWDEQKALLPACADYLRPIVLTALNTGMRKEEILSLAWDKVDFDKRLITVE
ncbi:phage integrase SAM-like domain-containing protein, partial [bacterium]|nr:phage integrase SAM-like domain-containing protein [bacterium]